MSKKKIRLFTPGPMNMSNDTLRIGGEQIPYFRDPEFAELTLENEALLLEAIGCNNGKVIPYTASGTGAMDAVMLNLISKNDRILVINGGSFGQRWCDLCDFYGFNYYSFDAGFGKNIDFHAFEKEFLSGYDIILMQAHETDSGQLFDVKRVGNIARKKNAILVVDATSSFMADDYLMDSYNADVTVISSQKGPKLPAGLACLILNIKALNKVKTRKGARGYYFDFTHYINSHSLSRGYTPFTPPVTVMYQLNHKFKKFLKSSRADIKETHENAVYFRGLIKDLPLKIVAETPSNFLTGLLITIPSMDVNNLYDYLKEDRFYITKPGKTIPMNIPDAAKRYLRVAHVGLKKRDHYLLYTKMKRFFEKNYEN